MLTATEPWALRLCTGEPIITTPTCSWNSFPGGVVGKRAGWSADMDPELAAMYEKPCLQRTMMRESLFWRKSRMQCTSMGPSLWWRRLRPISAITPGWREWPYQTPYALDLTLINVK